MDMYEKKDNGQYQVINLHLTIETIDRVRGITVDYANLYFPLRNVGFASDERRFNVAVSHI